LVFGELESGHRVYSAYSVLPPGNWFVVLFSILLQSMIHPFLFVVLCYEQTVMSKYNFSFSVLLPLPSLRGCFSMRRSDHQWLLRGVLLLSVFLLGACAGQAEPEPMKAEVAKVEVMKTGAAWVYEVEGAFEDVRDELIDAIESEGMVISYVSHAKSMLSRTAITVGGAGDIYQHAEVLLFCKADFAHRLIAENPHNLILCPYAIAVYTLRGENERVYLSIRKPEPGVPGFDQVHQMLQGLVVQVQEG